MKKTGLNKLLDKIRRLRKNGRRIVFTNGCFDLLHPGHIDYLKKAATLGDVLIIGINTDASVRKLKGRKRPYNTLKDRIYMLENLAPADYIIAFSEDTPERIISLIKPDILVKGGDYSPEDIAGKKYAGSIRIIPFRKGYSTTDLVEKIIGDGPQLNENKKK